MKIASKRGLRGIALTLTAAVATGLGLTVLTGPAEAVSAYTQNAFSAPASVAAGASFNLVANVSANPAVTVNDAKFCTRNSSNAIVLYTSPVSKAIPKTGVTLRQDAVSLPAGTYTSVPCVREGATGTYIEVGSRKTIVVTGTTSPSPSPTPTVSPSPTPTAPPTTGTKPNASNTGVPTGTTLTAYSGPTAITVPNTVIDGKVITSALSIQASGVVIKNSQISGAGSYCVLTQGGSVTLEDSEITGGCENAIGFDNWTATRVEIRGTYGDGVKLGSNVILQDSWIHDLAPANGAHADGGQVQGGITNTIVRRNNIDLGSTPNANAALFIAPDQGPSTNGPLTIEGNWLNGGNYVVYIVDGDGGSYFIRDIYVRDNKFGSSQTYGYSNVNVPITQSGNTVEATGAPLSL